MGRVVAGGNEKGNRINQLNGPTDVIVDKKTDSLIICDCGNRRVVRWPRQNGAHGQTIISNIYCSCRAIVAGGNGEGDNLNQLNWPASLFVDEDYSLYVLDLRNNCVMKWIKGAKEGIVVAGGQYERKSLAQLNHPQGVIVDGSGNVYVTDYYNHRIVCWSKGSKDGRVIVGENGSGLKPNQFNGAHGLSFDRQGNLYVVDRGNYRVQKFEIDLN